MNMSRLHMWHHHPGVRSGSELSRGERAADAMRNGMGSWPFIFIMFGIMITWMTLNVIGVINHWDEYPFILLNLCLSIMAGMQGAVIIIADKRGQQIAAELAQHDFDVNQEALNKINTMLETLLKLEAATASRQTDAPPQ